MTDANQAPPPEARPDTGPRPDAAGGSAGSTDQPAGDKPAGASRRRRSRGRGRGGAGGGGGGDTDAPSGTDGRARTTDGDAPSGDRPAGDRPSSRGNGGGNGGGRPAAPAAASASAPGGEGPPARPKIGDTRPAPAGPSGGAAGPSGAADGGPDGDGSGAPRKRRRRGGRNRSRSGGGGQGQGEGQNGSNQNGQNQGGGSGRQQGQGQGRGQGQRGQRGQGGQGGGNRGGRGGGRKPAVEPVTALTGDAPIELDEEVLAERRGRERKGKAVGRYLMAVNVRPEATQIAILEGRSLIEHQVSRPADDIAQIHGNIYLGRVQNVLPGMEAAFVDIGTPKNAVLYRGDTRSDPDDVDAKPKGGQPRIEEILKARQMILCQVTKNPIAHKGARLTQEVSLPGRFVVLVPDSNTYGISKRLPDDERKRLRSILDKVRPKGHGLIVRTAAEGITAEELEADLARLVRQWDEIAALAASSRDRGPTLLYREPDLAVRMIREEFNKEYRRVVIDDRGLFDEVQRYVASVNPALAERVEHYDTATEKLPLFEKHHVHEQLHKALDRKVWLPSGGSLIIEHTEALTVIDVNTGKNVGSSSLEQTVFANNLEAAEEVARQLRLRDIGGIIVIDFIDMEVAKNRDAVMRTFRAALARDKTRTQVFDISELGLVEMTRKRIGEGLLESFAEPCAHCQGRGVVFDPTLYPGD